MGFSGLLSSKHFKVRYCCCERSKFTSKHFHTSLPINVPILWSIISVSCCYTTVQSCLPSETSSTYWACYRQLSWWSKIIPHVCTFAQDKCPALPFFMHPKRWWYGAQWPNSCWELFVESHWSINPYSVHSVMRVQRKRKKYFFLSVNTAFLFCSVLTPWAI